MTKTTIEICTLIYCLTIYLLFPSTPVECGGICLANHPDCTAFTFWPNNKPTLCRLHYAHRLIKPGIDDTKVNVYVDVSLEPGKYEISEYLLKIC